MFETIVAGAVVAAISGTTYYAFREPDGFSSLFNLLIVLVIATQVIGITWMASLSTFHASIVPILNTEQVEIAKHTLDTLSIPSWYFLSGVGLCIYLLFLAIFPIHVKWKKK